MNGEWRIVTHEDAFFMRGASMDDASKIIMQAEKLLGHALPSRNVSILESISNGTAYYAIYNGPLPDELATGIKPNSTFNEWINQDAGNDSYYFVDKDNRINDLIYADNSRHFWKSLLMSVAGFIPGGVMMLLHLPLALSIPVMLALPIIIGILRSRNYKGTDGFVASCYRAVNDNNENVNVYYGYPWRESACHDEIELMIKCIKPVLDKAGVDVEDYRIVHHPRRGYGIAIVYKDDAVDSDSTAGRCKVDEVIDYVTKKERYYHVVRTFDKFTNDEVIVADSTVFTAGRHMTGFDTVRSIGRMLALQKSIGELEAKALGSNNISSVVRSQVENCAKLIKTGGTSGEECEGLITNLEAIESSLQNMLPNKDKLSNVRQDLDALVKLKARIAGSEQ